MTPMLDAVRFKKVTKEEIEAKYGKLLREPTLEDYLRPDRGALIEAGNLVVRDRPSVGKLTNITA